MDIRLDLASMSFRTPCATVLEASTVGRARLLLAPGNNHELNEPELRWLCDSNLHFVRWRFLCWQCRPVGE
jgi:hypothetical protein